MWGWSSLEHLGKCPEAIIGKNSIPKEKKVSIFLDNYHFNHPTWYNSLWTYSNLDQGAHNVYNSAIKKVQLWRSYCCSSTRVQAYIREPMICDCESHLKGYCSQFNRVKNSQCIWQWWSSLDRDLSDMSRTIRQISNNVLAQNEDLGLKCSSGYPSNSL